MSTSRSDSVLNFSDTAIADLAHLAQNSKHLDDVTTAALRLRPGIGVHDASKIIAEDTAAEPEEVNRALETFLNLYRIKIRLRMDTAQLIRTVTNGLEEQSPQEWKRDYRAAWKGATEQITKCLDTFTAEHPLAIKEKAEQLGVAHQKLFMEAKLVTDLRPVFDSSGNQILESLIIQTLLIKYFDGNEPQCIELALDSQDVAQLLRKCERAERKAVALKRTLGEFDWATVILGEEDSS